MDGPLGAITLLLVRDSWATWVISILILPAPTEILCLSALSPLPLRAKRGAVRGTTACPSACREESWARKMSFVVFSCNNKTQSSSCWLGPEEQLDVLRAELPSGHLPGAGGGTRRTWTQEPHQWDLAGASAAWACARLIGAN